MVPNQIGKKKCQLRLTRKRISNRNNYKSYYKSKKKKRRDLFLKKWSGIRIIRAITKVLKIILQE